MQPVVERLNLVDLQYCKFKFLWYQLGDGSKEILSVLKPPFLKDSDFGSNEWHRRQRSSLQPYIGLFIYEQTFQNNLENAIII